MINNKKITFTEEEIKRINKLSKKYSDDYIFNGNGREEKYVYNDIQFYIPRLAMRCLLRNPKTKEDFDLGIKILFYGINLVLEDLKKPQDPKNYTYCADKCTLSDYYSFLGDLYLPNKKGLICFEPYSSISTKYGFKKSFKKAIEYYNLAISTSICNDKAKLHLGLVYGSMGTTYYREYGAYYILDLNKKGYYYDSDIETILEEINHLGVELETKDKFNLLALKVYLKAHEIDKNSCLRGFFRKEKDLNIDIIYNIAHCYKVENDEGSANKYLNLLDRVLKLNKKTRKDLEDPYRIL